MVSGCIALTLTPMMCARFLKSDKQVHHGRVYLFFERMFARLLAGYEWGLKRALKFRLLTLCVFLSHTDAHRGLVRRHPEGLFPGAGHGNHRGSAEGAQDISSAAMRGSSPRDGQDRRPDPDVAGVGYAASAATFNAGTFFITLKPRSQRRASADQIIARLRPKLATIEGANLYLQASQDIRVGGRVGRTQYQYTLEDLQISTNSIPGPPSCWQSCKDSSNLPMLPATSRRMPRPRR